MESFTNAGEPRLYTRSFLLLGAANLLNMSGFGSFFLFPLYIIHHGGSKTDIGILMGVFSLSPVLSRPLISYVIDRIGRKNGFICGCLITSFIPLAYLFLSGDIDDLYFFLIVIRVIHGMGVALSVTSAITYAADIIPPGRLNEGIGMFGTSGLIGMAVGPVIGELVMLHLGGYHALFVTGAILSVLGAVMPRHLDESHAGTSNGTQSSFFRVLFMKRILVVVFLSILFGFGLAASGSFVTPYALELNLGFVSLYFVSYSLTAVLSRLFGGRMADEIGEKRVAPYAFFLTGVGFMALFLTKGNFLLILAGLINGFGHGLLFPCLNALALRKQPIELRGKINAAFTGGIDAGIFSGAFLLGYLGDYFGFPSIFLTVALALWGGMIFVRSTRSLFE